MEKEILVKVELPSWISEDFFNFLSRADKNEQKILENFALGFLFKSGKISESELFEYIKKD